MPKNFDDLAHKTSVIRQISRNLKSSISLILKHVFKNLKLDNKDTKDNISSSYPVPED